MRIRRIRWKFLHPTPLEIEHARAWLTEAGATVVRIVPHGAGGYRLAWEVFWP